MDQDNIVINCENFLLNIKKEINDVIHSNEETIILDLEHIKWKIDEYNSFLINSCDENNVELLYFYSKKILLINKSINDIIYIKKINK